MTRSAITASVYTLVALFGCGPGCRLTQRDVAVDQVIERNSESRGLRILEKIPGADLFGIVPPVEDSQELGLYAVTPFDQQKIPVVLIHGLDSDPSTWQKLLEQLGAEPEIVRNYQFWTFLYQPKNSILKSASDLRISLQDAMQQLDPKREHAPLAKMVLIGHSIGGLLAKFQVTHSDQHLWDAVSKASIETVQVDNDVRDSLREAFFFDPQPMVRKVIYIGVPHADPEHDNVGSLDTGRQLFELPASLRNGYRRLVDNDNAPLIEQDAAIEIDDNPFDSSSPIWKATSALRLGHDVMVHSIIGNAGKTPDGLPGDGLVAVASAKIAESETNWYVSAPHAELHRADDSIREVKRLLLQHLSLQLPQSESSTEQKP